MTKNELIDMLGAVEAHRKGDESFWAKHSGALAAGLLTLFFGFAGAWALQMDRQSVEITTKLDGISQQIGKIEGIDKRVSRIEDTRFSNDDADKIDARLRELEKRVTQLETQ